MKVLWFTNIPMPAVDRKLGTQTRGSGHWMTTLLARLSVRKDVRLGVATAVPGVKSARFVDGGVEYFVIGQPWRYPSTGIRDKDLAEAARITRDFSPDLVHVHGTERFFGLLPARGLIEAPAVLSIQGLIGPCRRAGFGGLGWKEVLRTVRPLEFAAGGGIVRERWRFAGQASREREMLSTCRHFIGRTSWDRAHVMAANPSARYHHVDELLREPFFLEGWSLEHCERHRVVFTNSGHPRRGVEDILDAVRILAEEFPGIRLCLAGTISRRSGYGKYLLEKIRGMGLSGRLETPGFLDGDALARELKRAHVFVIASHVENSPNTLCEAQAVGVPCVASYGGGIPSLVRDGETGLLFPVGDAPSLADRVRALFRDDRLAARIGRDSREAARARHEPGRVVADLLAAYRSVIRDAMPAGACPAGTGPATG